jgi:hypothetical protein
MKPKPVEKGILTPDQREDLEGKLLHVQKLLMCERHVDETTPELIALLDAWEACKVPYPALPTVNAYKCQGGSWLVGDVNVVLHALWTHIGDTASALAAYKRHLEDPGDAKRN